MRIEAVIGHRIRVDMSALPEGAALAIMEALSIPNQEKLNAQKQNMWGWQNLPDFVDLWEGDGRYLLMPRGFAHSFTGGMAAFGAKVDWVDKTSYKQLFRVGLQPKPRLHQPAAVQAILDHRQGIMKAPAGSGKTVVVLMAIRRVACKSIVIVNTKNIVTQWIDRVDKFLGPHFPVSQIGDGVFEVSPYLTIATAQTLHRRFYDLEDKGFFDEFGFMCLDESHHATADTYNRLVNRFSARYRIGVSATPDKTGDFALATNVLGPIFHETRPKELRDQGILMKPRVVRISTKFGFRFQGANGTRRSNYPDLIKRLIGDPQRNQAIVECIRREASHVNLILSKRLDHLDVLAGMLEDSGFPDPILMLTGREKNAERKEVEQAALSGPCAVFSTIADEALDIATLDRLHLIFPQRNSGLITQQVGRVERDHPGKKDAIVFDWVDANVGPLDAQWKVRRFEVYAPRGFHIENRKIEEFL